VLVAVLGVVGIVLAVRNSDERAVRTGSAQALAAADTAVVAVWSSRAGNVPAHLAQVRGYLTPAFAATYLSDQERLEGSAGGGGSGTDVSAVVRKSAVANPGARAATVLVFLDQITTGAGRSGARVTPLRLLVTMHRSGARWLIAGLGAG
jgi:hypothetical protein